MTKPGSIQHVVHTLYWTHHSGDPSYRVEICRESTSDGTEFSVRMFLLSLFEAYPPGGSGPGPESLASMSVYQPEPAFPPCLYGKVYATADACMNDVIRALEDHFGEA
jgi:hypothetical protein